MKKLWSLQAIMMTAIVSISLASCGGGDDDDGPGGNSGGGSTTEQVFTGTTSDVTASSATVSCYFSSTANASTLQLGLLYSTERSTIDNRQGTLALANTVEGSTYTVGLSSLLSNTIYYYRAYMVSGGTTYYGSVSSFTTAQDEKVTTGDATDITYNSATISSSFKYSVITSFSALGVQYSDSRELLESGKGSAPTTSFVTDNNVFTITLTGLNEQTTYYYRAYVTDYRTTYYGVIKSFTTTAHNMNANGHEYVDLGLPSGTMWATMNVGASKPEDFGDYYAWGEITTKTSYTKDNYQWQGLGADELLSRGVVREVRTTSTSSDYFLTASHDAATAKWGGNWRMPTRDDIKELESYTKITNSTQNGVVGFLLTSTRNNNSIFLPAAGEWRESGFFNYSNTKTYPDCYYGSCLSSELSSRGDGATYSIGIHMDTYALKSIISYSLERHYGIPVRPVIQ